MATNQLGVLHTNSAYITSVPLLPHISEDTRLNRIAMQIRSLKIKEDAFAQRFGYSTIEDFIKGIREILQANPADILALQQFSSGQLQRHLNQFKVINSNMVINQQVILTFEGEGAPLQKIFSGQGQNWTMIGPNAYLLPEWDTKLIKNAVNKTYSKTFHTRGSGANSIDRLVSFLRSNGANKIKLEIGQQQESLDEFVVNHAVSPFELKPKELKQMVSTSPELVEELKGQISRFIYDNLCAGASDEFKRAVKTIWDQKFTSLESLAFFMGGKGWSTQALGAFGELQTAIMFQYIANKTPNKIMAAKISEIIGDNLNSYGQQFHTDLKIFEAFGIQVKNYEGTKDFRTGTEKTVEVHLHPSEVASLGASEGVVDYIVNSYFNADIPKYPDEQLNEFFKSHASELLNLDFNANIPDQVSFYMIGPNFIPGSAILEAAFQEVSIKVSTTMSGQTGGTDESFATGDDHNWHEKFTKWWESTQYPPTAGMFQPTADNTIDAWDRNVSIRTKFTYSALFEGAYRLF